MRLWSIHPKYLDAKGLVALWREGLLAQKVLQGATRGYKSHPQLARFRRARRPEAAIATYLCGVLREAAARGYRFDAAKIAAPRLRKPLPVTKGQARYELEHLRAKLAARDPARHAEVAAVRVPELHPSFAAVAGGVEAWERT